MNSFPKMRRLPPPEERRWSCEQCGSRSFTLAFHPKDARLFVQSAGGSMTVPSNLLERRCGVCSKQEFFHPLPAEDEEESAAPMGGGEAVMRAIIEAHSEAGMSIAEGDTVVKASGEAHLASVIDGRKSWRRLDGWRRAARTDEMVPEFDPEADSNRIEIGDEYRREGRRWIVHSRQGFAQVELYWLEVEPK